MESLLSLITTDDPDLRNQSLDARCATAGREELLAAAAELDAFRRREGNLYDQVRALFFLYDIHRFHLPRTLESDGPLVPFHGFEHLLNRRFEEAIDAFLSLQAAQGPSDGLCSALASAYHRLAFQTLADQVRRSVRTVRGNQWMFRMGHPADQPLRIRPELLQKASDDTYPILRELTPVRMDLTHSAWSDIFFLGMDYPEGAKVLNISVDLGVHGRDAAPRPPVSAWLRVIEEPVLRLTSVDLGCTADLQSLADVFDFAKDYLGLLKAAVIASGLVPPGIEGSGQSLAELLARVVGPGLGLEVVSCVNDIPKGSRLAVSTNLLGSLIAVCMRATGQTSGEGGQASSLPGLAGFQPAGAQPAQTDGRQAGSPSSPAGWKPALRAGLTGPLSEADRRIVLARALLGEWLGGSGGGWQDSGGVWPGIKLITGVAASEGDPEFSISRGRLMPVHQVFSRDVIPESARQALMDSLVVVHGGMAQNVGPILEMVTEKYLLRSTAEWQGRQEALGVLDEVISALTRGDIRALGAATTRNFRGPIQTIIPWASTAFTERLIDRCEREFGADFWGFWMLGGMSGGGMGFIFAPARKAEAQDRLQAIMLETKRELQQALPFAMDPVVFDYAINEQGTCADLLTGPEALLPPGYYALTIPSLLRLDPKKLPPVRRLELDKFGAAARNRPELRGMVQTLFEVLLPRNRSAQSGGDTLQERLERNGFDRAQHEQIRADLKEGRIGLAQNRLRPDTQIEDVLPEDVIGGQASSLPGPTGFQPVGSHPSAPVVFQPFDRQRAVTITHRRMPHWQQDGATYFVTFRLADSMPAEAFEKRDKIRAAFLSTCAGRLTPAQEAELEERLWEFDEAELDRGYGTCLLRQPENALIVETALHHFDGERYALGRWVVMPNHVHVLVTPLGDSTPSRILHSWKSYTANQINRRLGRSGPIWQTESFDRIVRNEERLGAFDRYISENPVKAQIPEGEFRSGCGSGGRQAGSPSGRAGWKPALPVPALRERGETALRNGEVAIVTLAAGAGSRWTGGAGTCKALHPYAKLAGRHRTFLETHLAKSRRISRLFDQPLPHLVTTSYATHQPIDEFLRRVDNYHYEGPLLLSPGRSVGLRLIPTERDLRFQWEEMPQQVLDVQQQKLRDNLRLALIDWARHAGEASDYTDNLPLQCLHPVGHFFEIPNLLRNGVLARLLTERPQLKHLLLHNIDTLGADADPEVLGLHLESNACLTFEVITRRIEDRGGGLARVNGRVRLVEGLAMPREEDEFRLSYYNSMTTWIDLDRFLDVLGLTRAEVLAAGPASLSPASNPAQHKVTTAIRNLAAKLPTYVTLKEVKKRWGHGQEDVFPVAQFEKLWSDLTALPEVDSRFVVVPRRRGQQLKDQAQLDGWLRDGSAAYVESLCAWE